MSWVQRCADVVLNASLVRTMLVLRNRAFSVAASFDLVEFRVNAFNHEITAHCSAQLRFFAVVNGGIRGDVLLQHVAERMPFHQQFVLALQQLGGFRHTERIAPAVGPFPGPFCVSASYIVVGIPAVRQLRDQSALATAVLATPPRTSSGRLGFECCNWREFVQRGNNRFVVVHFVRWLWFFGVLYSSAGGLNEAKFKEKRLLNG